MRFPSAALLITFMVLFSIAAPLASLYATSQSLTETITIVFARDAFEYEGEKLYGFIIVSLDSPNSFKEYTITTNDIERGRVHRSNFDRQVE